ncbi:LysR family transcriptional regulator [Aquibium microcysteis]|uniref:LysR family transcriptional regulator n=1 Tax=Aquibium microcysteis TaxID=675281 RepID=UPI00165D1436|nr:LysR family transcriptional regulator [Aquibium microcysteis]
MSEEERPPTRAGRGLQVRSVDLRSFVVLSRTRHFRRAAEELATSQPAISARIAALEEELGCRLIERGDGAFRLTEAGERALETFETVLAELDRLAARLRREPEPVAATLRIGAIDTVAATWLPGLIETLHARYPHLRVELTVDGTKALALGLKKGFFDIIFAIQPVVDEGFRSFTACVLQMGWVGSPRLINPDRTYTPQDLAAMPIISFPKDSPPFQMVAPYFHDEQVLASKLTSCNSLYAIVSLILDGFGVAALPSVAIRRELANGRLVSMKVTKHFPSMPVVASYQALTHHQFIRAVVDESRRAAALFCAAAKPGTAWVE